ncbi:MAG TPA: universal stress protein [Ohtaekwangia sp.]|uniref:universal stress protein n=1 Tax=Ohtaekwangia sp. TaxID=2066019 RepID=UPI002F94AC4E
MKNILVPCDFSDPAEEAFRFAIDIARQSEGEVHVLHVIDITFLQGNPSLSYSYAFNLSFLKEIEKDAEDKFNAMRNRHAAKTVAVKFKHIIGSLISEIESYIKTNGINLVVMGTQGTGHAKYGSNTAKVVRHVQVPVITIHTAPEAAIRNIVYPVIPEQKDDALVSQVKELQKFFHARLNLLWVNTPFILKPDPDAQRELQVFAQEFGLYNYTINIRSDYTIEDGVEHFSREIDADMIAMGTHAWKGILHLVVGSITEDVVNHQHVPVWTCFMK